MEIVEQKDNISFSDLKKLDIRICEVKEAERVKKTDKLIKLVIDTGIDLRESITNLGSDYEVEDFIGKRFPFIINLEPVIIKKIETKAMLFCFSDNINGVKLVDFDMEIGSNFL